MCGNKIKFEEEGGVGEADSSVCFPLAYDI